MADVIETNLNGVFFSSQAASKVMLKKKAGPHHQHCLGRR